MNPTGTFNPLCLEWQTLQNNHEQHERNALLIKLTCLALSLLGLAAHVPGLWLAIGIALLWVQEGIIKTYQTRLANRLLRVEALMLQTQPEPSAMQLHTQWVEQRPNGAALIAGYFLSACRPTVAFPYVPLLVCFAVARSLS
jgi:hypothetical protein